MKKNIREEVFKKYNGLCGYTGTPLEPDWQVDHMTSVQLIMAEVYSKSKSDEDYKKSLDKLSDINNLMPTQKIINHYKRAQDIEMFRKYMSTFHLRLKKLPKNTKIKKTQARKDYLYKIAELFGISPDTPFSGKFYFETINTNE